MVKRIRPSKLSGELKIIPSKSGSHRALICAALSPGRSVIENIALSDDIAATLQALCDMGFCAYEINGDTITVAGGKNRETKSVINCRESGSTLRFLLPLAFDGQKRTFKLEGRLKERPMQPYEELFAGYGYHKKDDTIEVLGELPSGKYGMRGDVSSQFVSGLLFKLPTLEGNSEIEITTGLESLPYIELTRQMQERFGIKSEFAGGNFVVRGNQNYMPTNMEIEGDFSHAAFFAVAAAISGNVTLLGLDKNSLQGDKQILEIIRVMGGSAVWQGEHTVRVSAGKLKPIELDVSQIPDLVPALAVLLCAANGSSKLYNAERLRFKESDRLSAVATELLELGADITEYEDSLVIHGTGSLRGGKVSSHNDHRIAMALTVASVLCENDVLLDGAGAVSKSAPAFFNEFASLGGIVDG